MWNVDTKLMCDKHLLGEHVEMHMFVGCIRKRMSLDGYLKNNLVRIDKIRERHDELVKEFERRGFFHNSPIGRFDYRYLADVGRIDADKNLKDLEKRCLDCKRKSQE